MKYSLILWAVLFTIACSLKEDGKELSASHLEARNLVADHTIDETLDSLLPGVNCILRNFGSKYFATAKSYNSNDSNQILLIPFRRKSNNGTSSGFSDIEKRISFICPTQIKAFVSKNSLSDSSKIDGYLGIILLHEAGHFLYRLSGHFDEESNPPENVSKLGQQDMGTEPVVMTIYKRQELKVDSTAIEMVKKALKVTKGDCFGTSFNIELAINGAEFMLFGKRLFDQFGLENKTIKDQALTHPNLELRLAFMNYYLNPTSEKRQQIDQYIYDREIAPINRQLTDPRIFQGDEKVLPE